MGGLPFDFFALALLKAHSGEPSREYLPWILTAALSGHHSAKVLLTDGLNPEAPKISTLDAYRKALLNKETRQAAVDRILVYINERQDYLGYLNRDSDKIKAYFSDEHYQHIDPAYAAWFADAQAWFAELKQQVEYLN